MITQVYPQIQLAIIQATPFCNIDCDYCYLPGRSLTRRMKWETLEKVAQRLLDNIDNQPPGTEIIASGTSCRHQITDLSNTRPKHMAELIAEALP